MQNNRPFSPTHRPSGILPPLSKYYYGPAVSPDRSPAQGKPRRFDTFDEYILNLAGIADTGWDTPNPQGAPALLPRRLSPNPASAPPLSQWAPYQNGLPQQQTRIFPGPPSTAPPAHPVAQSSYNPNTYGPMPGARLSPINPTWNQSSPSVASPDTSKWGVHYQQVQAKLSQTQLKPPLPVSTLYFTMPYQLYPTIDMRGHPAEGAVGPGPSCPFAR